MLGRADVPKAWPPTICGSMNTRLASPPNMVVVRTHFTFLLIVV